MEPQLEAWCKFCHPAILKKTPTSINRSSVASSQPLSLLIVSFHVGFPLVSSPEGHTWCIRRGKGEARLLQLRIRPACLIHRTDVDLGSRIRLLCDGGFLSGNRCCKKRSEGRQSRQFVTGHKDLPSNIASMEPRPEPRCKSNPTVFSSQEQRLYPQAKHRQKVAFCQGVVARSTRRKFRLFFHSL